MHSTVEGLLDSIHWWLIYFCDFLFPLLKDMCISHHALVHGSKWPSSLGNPAPLHLHGDQLSSRQDPQRHSCQLGGLEDGVELQPQEGPKPHTKFSPGRAGVPSCPGGTPLTAMVTPHSSLICTWTQLTFCFGQEHWSSWRRNDCSCSPSQRSQGAFWAFLVAMTLKNPFSSSNGDTRPS